MRVVLIEDNPGDVLLCASPWIPSMNRTVWRFSQDGEQALRFVRESAQKRRRTDAALCLLDLRYARNDGLDVLRAIREAAATSNLNVAVLTGGFISRRERADLLSFDVRSILVKPSNLDGYVNPRREDLPDL